eukprot:gb/GECH01008781.1/.p1 GENE.gb/GECH01008781.1/~~gb/GECH01008781.1/.p1  ORF type:complete len:319 (+),score=61.30 gb/GECH01008781.1/:1-957(+)
MSILTSETNTFGPWINSMLKTTAFNAQDRNTPEDYPKWDDAGMFFMAVVVVLGIRFVLVNGVFRPLSKLRLETSWKKTKKALSDENGKPKDLNENNLISTQVNKSCDSLWKATYYAVTWSMGFYVCVQEGILKDTTLYWSDYPFHKLTWAMRLYYMASTAFYFSSIFTMFWETRRSDHWALFGHHIATVSLLLLSYVTRFYRIGIMVLIVHDVNDIFLEGAKVFKYLNLQRFADIMFAIFAVSWFITRFWMLHRYVTSSVDNEPFQYFDPPFSFWMIFSYLLHFLQILHIYWGFLIARIAINGILGKDIDDIREDDED